MAANLDNLKLEIAFADGPDVVSPAWTDVTAYWVRNASTTINRGRGDERSDISPGTLSLTLDNTDGRFTVGNASSPYYPNVKIRKQIRITYTESAVTYLRYHGHIDDWGSGWPTGDSTLVYTTLSASDRTKRLGAGLPLRSVPIEDILANDPRAYFPLSEPSGSTGAGDITTNGITTPLRVTQTGTGGEVRFGDGTGPSTDAAAAVVFEPVDSSNGKTLRATSAAGYNLNTSGFSFEFTFAANGNNYDLVTFGDSLGQYVKVSLTNLGKARLGVQVDGALPGGSNSANDYNDAATHHCLVTVVGDAGGAQHEMFIDDVSVVSFTTAGWTTTVPTWTTLTVGGLASSAQHTISNVVAVTPGHYDAIMTGFAGESTDARITRIAGWVGMGSFLNLDAGATTSLTHIDTTGRNALDVMKDIAATESGQLFAGRDGKLTFHARTRRFAAAVAATLTTSGQDIGEGLQFVTNDQFLLNDVTVTSGTGGITHVKDATSITDFGIVRDDRSVYTTSETEARSAAEWMVAANSTPTPRAQSLEVDLLTNDSARVAALGLDISSRVSLTGLPTGASSTADLMVEGYTETISLADWSLSLNTSPAELYSSMWKLGTAGYSELGQTTRLSF